MAVAPLAVPLEASCSVGAAGEILPVDVAAAKAIAAARPVVEVERVALLEARGRIAARPVGSPMRLPPFDNSAMDGYAVRRADLSGDGPWRLPVQGLVKAGDAASAPEGKCAVRIFTGAPVPEGFDAVVMQERCEVRGGGVVIGCMPRPGENVRRAGEDVGSGSRLVDSGDVLTPQRLALLAGAGIAEVEVYRKVRVSVVSTGNELREPGETLAPGQIYNSNRTFLRSSLASLPWVEALDFGIVADNREALLQTFAEAVDRSDVIVTTGGVSAGEEDHVAAVLRDSGAELEVLKVAMRPGKPLKVGLIGGALVAALPGNPNAALVTFRQIALPAIRTAGGLRQVRPEWQAARSGFAYGKLLGRTEFVPVRIVSQDADGLPVLEMLGRGSSASLSALAFADGIAILPPDVEAVEPGTPLRFESIR
ncbi:molybdopterin molybdotransferase [Aquamicrobium terrae]